MNTSLLFASSLDSLSSSLLVACSRFGLHQTTKTNKNKQERTKKNHFRLGALFSLGEDWELTSIFGLEIINELDVGGRPKIPTPRSTASGAPISSFLMREKNQVNGKVDPTPSHKKRIVQKKKETNKKIVFCIKKINEQEKVMCCGGRNKQKRNENTIRENREKEKTNCFWMEPVFIFQMGVTAGRVYGRTILHNKARTLKELGESNSQRDIWARSTMVTRVGKFGISPEQPDWRDRSIPIFSFPQGLCFVYEFSGNCRIRLLLLPVSHHSNKSCPF